MQAKWSQSISFTSFLVSQPSQPPARRGTQSSPRVIGTSIGREVLCASQLAWCCAGPLYKEADKLNLQEGVGANRIAERGSEFVGRKGKGVSC